MFIPKQFDADFDFSDKGNWEKFLKKIEKLLEFNPHDAEAYFNRSLCYAALGKQEQSVDDFCCATDLNSESADVYFYWRGHIHLRLGRLELAIEDLTETIKLSPDDFHAFFHRGIAHAELGNLPEALEDFDEAVDIDPDDPEAYYHRGATYAEMERYEEAVCDFDRLIELSPKDEEAYLERGLVYRKMGDEEKATASFKASAELGCDAAKVYLDKKKGEEP